MAGQASRQRRHGRVARAGLAVLGLLAGNAVQAGSWWCVDNCADIPRGAIPQPAGTFLHQWQTAQATKAEADDFVIYKHEWYLGGLSLGPYGMYHLNEILKRLPSQPFAVVLQPELNAGVNESRRLSLIQQLAHAGIPNPETRVLVAFPQAEGLYGEEAVRLFARSISGQGAAATAVGGGLGATSGIGGMGGAAPFSGVGGSLGIPSRGY